jgi:hypothetical protein
MAVCAVKRWFFEGREDESRIAVVLGATAFALTSAVLLVRFVWSCGQKKPRFSPGFKGSSPSGEAPEERKPK